MAAPRSRPPAVSGYYYPDDAQLLTERIDTFARLAGARAEPAIAAVVPHGSYGRSGMITGAVLGRVRIPRRVVVVGPSHTGSLLAWSLMTSGWYRTPLGEVAIDEDAGLALQARCQFLEADPWGQRGEHAIEVPVPFLQRLGPRDLRLVPIVTNADDAQQFARLGTALAQLVRLLEEPVLLIASSDFSHYRTREETRVQDRALCQAIAAFDVAGLTRLARDPAVLMCGYGAVAAVLAAARQLGARLAEPVATTTSAEAGGDPDAAVGYAGIVIR